MSVHVKFTGWSWSGYAIHATLEQIPERGEIVTPFVYSPLEDYCGDVKRHSEVIKEASPYKVVGRKKHEYHWVIYCASDDREEAVSKDYYHKYASD